MTAFNPLGHIWPTDVFCLNTHYINILTFVVSVGALGKFTET